MIYRIRIHIFCLVATLCCATTCCTSSAEAEYNTLALQTRRIVGWDKRRAKQVSGLLVRELARQSLLITARDELGILTQDQTLRENGVGGETELKLLLTVDARLNKKCGLKITQVGEKNKTEVWSRSIKFEPNSRDTYQTLIPQFEAFSRGEFVDLLRQLGVAKATSNNETSSGSPNPEDLQEIDLLLQEVDLFSQFVAVRRLHKLIRNTGESPELLGLLVNGYAHLGLLTEGTWGADSQAFKARSLIYAQRLRKKYSDYVFSRWHWSYAQAIAGIHFTALKQLKDPIPELGEGIELPSLPIWGELVAPCCRYDTEALQSLADRGNRWARYLRLWALSTGGADRQIDLSAEAIVKDCPEAFNIYTLLGNMGSIGVMHMAGPESIQAMMQSSTLRWSESGDLPAAARRAALTPPTQKSPLVAWGKVIESLRQEKDQSELSWHMLANLLEDTATMVAAANLHMAEGGSQEHSMAPYVDIFWPAIKDHPHASLIEARKYSVKEDLQKIQKICQDLRFEDPSLWIGNHAYFLWNIKNSRGEPIGYNSHYGASRDFTATSMSLVSNRQTTNEKTRTMYIRELRKISPHSPLGLIHEIIYRSRKAGEVDPNKIVKWKELAGVSARAWYELGRLHVRRQEYEASYECFQASFEISPEHNTIREWAWAYEYAKEFEQVVPTFKRDLEVEDFGLGHSNTHYEIARFYLRREKPEEAKPHALEAAQSWSGRGLGIAATVCERLNLVEEADQWYQRLSSSYPSSSGMKWYLWRRRSGNTDVLQARELFQREVGKKALEECTASGWWPLAYYLMESDRERATKLLKLRIEPGSTLFRESHLLCVVLEEGDESLVAQSLARMQELATGKDSKEGGWNLRYVEAIRAVLNAKSKDDISTDHIDELVRYSNSKLSPCNICYFFSKLLQAKGFAEQASQYRSKAISTLDTTRITWHLASYDASRLKTDEDSKE